MALQDEWLECHLPGLGVFRARLYPLAHDCYRLLSSKGHIERLRAMDQLGMIRSVFPGAHHSRWEYVISQIALIHKLSELNSEDTPSIPNVGLGSKCEFHDSRGRLATGADVMQCWVLLLNSGHLNGTFSAEEGLLRILRDPALRNAFLATSGFHDDNVMAFMGRVIDRGVLYDMHKAITFFFLHRYARGRNRDLVLTLIEVLKWYCGIRATHAAKRDNLSRTFQRIRQLCYLSLDSQYLPTPMRLDLGSVFLNIEERAVDICSVDDSPLCRELDGFNLLMEHEIYCAPRVLLQHERGAGHVERTVDSWYAPGARGIDGVAEDLHRHEISDMRKVITALQEKPTCPRDLVGYEDVLSMPLYLTVQRMRSPEVPLRLRNRIQDNCGRRNLDVSVLRNLGRETAGPRPRRRPTLLAYSSPQFFISLGLRDGIRPSERLRFHTGLVRIMADLEANAIWRPSYLHTESPVSYISRSPICNEWSIIYLDSFLRSITTDCRFMIDASEGYVARVGRGSRGSAEVLRGISEDIDNASRKHELTTHARALETVAPRGCLISCLAPISVYRSDGTSVTDIDGLSVVSTSNGLSLLLVEVKNQRAGALAAARNQLEQRIDDIKMTGHLSDPTIHDLGRDAVYAYSSIAC